MQESSSRNLWKHAAAEAAEALTLLDADRLEQLGRFCRGLQGEMNEADPEGRQLLAVEAREAASDVAVLGRILTLTGANLAVLRSVMQSGWRSLGAQQEYERPAHLSRFAGEGYRGDN